MLDIAWYFLIIHISLVGFAQAQVDRDHLCDKVMSGRLDRLELKSFTYYKFGQLVIFEGSRKYYIDRGDIKQDTLPIPLIYQRWDSGEMRLAIDQMKLPPESNVLSVYMTSFNNPDSTEYPWCGFIRKYKSFKCTRVGLSVITANREYMSDIFYTDDPVEFWMHNNRHYPEFALVFEQEKKTLSGYVIHKDIYGNTSDYILYDLKINQRTLEWNVHDLGATAHTKEHAQYYYLEKTTNPNQILLVNRQNRESDLGSDPDRQLFQSQPVGYRHNSITYLFDSKLGCVYALNMLQISDTAYQQKLNLVGQRKNIPFEIFFNCPSEFSFDQKTFEANYPANRCDNTYYGYVSPVTTHESHGLFDWSVWTNKLIILVFACVTLLTILVVLIAFIFIYSKRANKKKKPKQNQKLPFNTTRAQATPGTNDKMFKDYGHKEVSPKTNQSQSSSSDGSNTKQSSSSPKLALKPSSSTSKSNSPALPESKNVASPKKKEALLQPTTMSNMM